MRITRIYQSQIFALGQKFSLDENASKHLLRVLRSPIGTELIVFNGEGGEYRAQLIGEEKKHAVIIIKEFLAIERESPLFIHLAQGISRGEKMDYVIQKAVELGVNKITPLFTEFSQVKLNEERLDKRLAHWRAIVIGACEQAGRNRIPEIAAPQLITRWLPQCQQKLKLILDPQATQHLKDLKKIDDICFLVGPEGGLSSAEINLAKQNNFSSLQLGPRVLRTETASLAMLAALQGGWGDF